MKVVITHKDLDCKGVNVLRFFIEKGKGINKKLTFYDYTYFISTKRFDITSFELFYWEIHDLKQHFSIYNKL